MRRGEHGFTSVDEQPEPDSWVAVLDRIRREPFYRAYKRRVLELLAPCDGGVYLDVGAGAGDDAREIATSARCGVIAADRSFTMASTCRARGGVHAIVCDAGGIPFRGATFDGCRADRVLQHIADPESALAEMVRVSKPGARVVAVDPDYDTQVMEFPDQEIARRVLRYRADRMLRHGTIAHRMPALFANAGMHSITVEPMTLVVRDPAAVDNVMGLRTWARTASEDGALSGEQADRWERIFDETARAGKFLYAVTFFITSGTR